MKDELGITLNYYSIMSSLLNKKDRDLTPIWDKVPSKSKSVYFKRDKVIVPNKLYRRTVKALTEENVHLINNIELRKFRVYDVDHKISIDYGFKHNIAPYCIADISNLRLITNKINADKGINVLIDGSNLWIVE